MEINKLNIQYITNELGEPTAVILPINEFTELMKDTEDLIAIVTGKREPPISHEALLKELANENLLSKLLDRIR